MSFGGLNPFSSSSSSSSSSTSPSNPHPLPIRLGIDSNKNPHHNRHPNPIQRPQRQIPDPKGQRELFRRLHPGTGFIIVVTRTGVSELVHGEVYRGVEFDESELCREVAEGGGVTTGFGDGGCWGAGGGVGEKEMF